MFDFIRNLWNNARRGVGIIVALIVGLAILPFVVKAVFNGLTSFGLGDNWATIIIVSLLAIFGFALWGNLTGVPELGRPASATWRQIVRFTPLAIIVGLLIFGWSKFSSETGLGRMIDAEIRDQSAIWNTEAEITNFRADTRAHSRQVVAVRDTPIYVMSYGKYVKTDTVVKRGKVLLVNIAESRGVNFGEDGELVVRNGTLTLVSVRPFNDIWGEPGFVDGSDLAPAGHAPILEEVDRRQDVNVRNSEGIREYYIDLEAGEETQVLGGRSKETDLHSVDGREFCIRVLGAWDSCERSDIPRGRPFVVYPKGNGVRLRVTEITSR